MVSQSVLGLLFQEQYRDAEWIKAMWFGNDWVTLLIGAPLLVVALLMARGGSVPGLLLWFGLVGYGFYKAKGNSRDGHALDRCRSPGSARPHPLDGFREGVW